MLISNNPVLDLGLHPSTEQKYIRNIKHFYHKSTKLEKLDGSVWYIAASTYVAKVSNMTGVAKDVVASVLSVLSPQNKWERNCLDALNMCQIQSKKLKVSFQDITVGTFNGNKEKAIKLLEGNFNIPQHNLKTYNFMMNICNPHDSNYITIDRHAHQVAMKDFSAKKQLTITPKHYKQLAHCYAKVAEELNIKPCQLQAITWLSYKRIVGR